MTSRAFTTIPFTGGSSNIAAVPTNNLAGAVESLSNALDQRQKEIASLTQQLDQAKKQVADAISQMTQNQQTLEKHLAEVRGQAEQASAGAQQYQTSKDQQIQQLQESFGQTQKGAQDQLAASQQQITDLNKKLTAAQHAIKLAKFQDLPRKLNKLQKDATAKSGKPIVSTAVYLDKLMDIVRAYPLEVEDAADLDKPESDIDLSGFEPKIILSESFVSRS